MSKLNALIAGSTGYIGIQLIKLLVKHRKVNIKYLCGNKSLGKEISSFDKSLKNKSLPKIVKFKKKFLKEVDIIFTALPNGQSQIISNYLQPWNTLIDLAADFRLKKSSNYLKWYNLKHKSIKNIKKSIYSVPEIVEKKVQKYNIIACPGCYPTSILLPIIPLLKKNLIKNYIIIDSKSGYSGAGRGIHKKYKNKNLYESLSAYGVGFHRHNSELSQEFKNYTNKDIRFIFTPHLTPMFRGMLSTIYLEIQPGLKLQNIQNELKKFYKKKRFIKILPKNTLISTNDTINTNNCYISVFKSKFRNKLIILSAIDNLIKGGAGQAVQNMNLKFKFNEHEGLV